MFYRAVDRSVCEYIYRKDASSIKLGKPDQSSNGTEHFWFEGDLPAVRD